MVKNEDKRGRFSKDLRSSNSSRFYGKKAQVTIFIIVAILIVLAVLIFFFWVRPEVEGSDTKRIGFEGCVQDALENSIETLAPNAGFIEPEFTYQYNGSEVVYLCYTNKYYETCTVQMPFLKQHFEDQIKRSIREEVNVCYENSLNTLKSEGYDVVGGDVKFEILVEPGRTRAVIEAPTTVGTSKYKKFNVELGSDLYEMIMRATSILQYEASLGDSDVASMVTLYPNILIEKMKRSDGTTIYNLQSKTYGTKMRFASRSLAWPAGYR